MKTWRLMTDPVPRRGSLNMAVDEFLFNSARKRNRTYLRFYQWETPTVSLGYGQEADRAVDLDFCRANGISIVRRMTGGKVVLHDRELTYSLSTSDTEVFTPTLQGAYELIALALLNGLSLMGLSARLAPASPPAYLRATQPCFTSPAKGEIEIDDRKLIGSAQKRVGPAFLQHGSIPLDKDATLLKSVARFDGGDDRIGMGSLSEALGRPVPFDWAASRFAKGFSGFFRIGLEPFCLDEEAWQKISAIEAERYGNDKWTFKQRNPRSSFPI